MIRIHPRPLRSWARGRLLLALCCLLSLAAAVAQTIAPVITVAHGPNTPEQQAKPYVVLVSLDGFRYDYAQKYHAVHLLQMAKAGASAEEGMLPAYPSVTFPNHYTLVTGLYPEHHGIVAMSFYDPSRKQRYSFNDPATSNDGSWYGGVPLWALAEQQGMRAACFFWPGSEAEIAGTRPSYYLKFDEHFPEMKRIEQVIAWLRLPPEQRPHFITLYYGTVDHTGHEFGPDAPETAAAVKHVDELIGELRIDLAALHLPIDLIVVSDHGMAQEQGPWINLDHYADLSHTVTVGSLLYPDSEAAAEKLYQSLKIQTDQFTVYRRKRVPAELEYNSNPREGDPIVVPNGPFAIRARAPENGGPDRPPSQGMHGYDAHTIKDMRAIFYAEGPGIRTGVTVHAFENVNVYPLIAHLLGLSAPKTDGSLNVLSGILAEAP